MTTMAGRCALRWPPATACLIALMYLFVVAPAHAQQSGTIVGRVTDGRSAQPLAGITIEVEGLRLGAITGSDGRYRITNVPLGTQSVAARRIGYAVARRSGTVSSDQQLNLDFDLQVTAAILDQVVITGTAGGEQRRSIGNAVATIDASDMLAKSAATNLTSLLNARSPGLNVLPTTGRLGAGPAIQIRGRSSLSLSNNPLIYVDGVRVNSASGTGPNAVAGGLAGQGSQVGGRLNDINPDDIESIEVISGPAAATIYGTEAASGVIQIVTKRGRAGDKPQVSLRAETGSLYFRDVIGRVPTNYAKNAAGAIVTWNGAQQEADSGRPLYRTGLTRQYSGAVSGGRDQIRYYVAPAYENSYGIEPNNSLRQFSLHANVNAPMGSRTDLATSLNYVVRSEHLGADQGVSPLIGTQYGQIVLFPTSRGFYAGFPPEVPQKLYDNAVGVNRFTGSTTLTNRPTNWFTHRAIAGVDYTTEDRRAIERFAPPELARFVGAAATGRIGQTLPRNTLITADYSGTAKFDLTAALSSSTSIGGQFYNTESNTSTLGGSGFPAPGVETVSSVTAPVGATQTQTINTTIGAYGQQQFGWRDRLFLTAALRVDNNSAFGEDFKWVTYPKLGASWVINEEPFWKWSSVVNTLRLRAAYGESGRQPATFSALRTFLPIAGASAVTPGSIGNPDLKPERGKELEVGLETNLWGRLQLDLTYYDKHTFDAILNQAVAPSSGFSATRPVNIGRVDNHGFELQGSLQALTRRNFAWEITGNVASNKDVVKDLGGLSSLITAAGPANVVGYPIQGLWSRRIASATRDPATNLATNILCDGGDGKPAVACATAPFIFLGTQTPTVTGGVANSFNFGRRLRLFAFVDFKRGHTLSSSVETVRCTGLLGAGVCRANYFPQEFSTFYVAEATTTAFSQNYLDQYYHSGSFVKLREVSATYTIPQQWVRGISEASFTLAARELHTWTKWPGLDPEGFVGTNDQAVTPPLNRILATINIKW